MQIYEQAQKFIKAWIPRKQILKGLKTCSTKSSSPDFFPIMIMSCLITLFPVSPHIPKFASLSIVLSEVLHKIIILNFYFSHSSHVWQVTEWAAVGQQRAGTPVTEGKEWLSVAEWILQCGHSSSPAQQWLKHTETES